jgi:hypothetical protein
MGCAKPGDVDCTDLSELIPREEPIPCKDGNEIQLCNAPDSDNCGYYVNAMYIPCRTCNDCDAASRVAVALCLGLFPSVDSSFTDHVADDSAVKNAESLLDAME